jgi:hypothetical protein
LVLSLDGSRVKLVQMFKTLATFDALEQSDKFAASHVLLTNLRMDGVAHNFSGATKEWNHLRVTLKADGTVVFYPEQIPAIRAFWLDTMSHGAAPH